MIQTIYKKGPISINHIWYMESEDQLKELNKADAYFLHGVNGIYPEYLVTKGKQNTLISDLTLSEEDLWSKVNRRFRGDILKCTNEECVYEIIKSDDINSRSDLIEKFILSYNQMYSSKGMKTTFNRSQFDSYVKENAVWICVAYKDDEPVVFHAYIVEGKNARLWYSCSNFRDDKEGAAEIGRLNKYLHWKEMTQFPSMGITRYDWGGVDFDNPKVKGISEFKSRFGPEECTYENVIFTKSRILKSLLKFVVKL